MTPDENRYVVAWLSAAMFGGLTVLLGTQLWLWPRDRQQWSATVFVLTLWVLFGQLALSYFGGPPLGPTTRGVASYGAAVVATLGFAYETVRHNWAAIRQNK